MGANVFYGDNLLLLLPQYDHHHRQATTFLNPTRSSSCLAFSFTLISNNNSCRQAIVGAKARRPRTRVLSATVSSDVYVPTQSSETYYDVLGVSENGTFSDIKKAFKQLAKKFHPDVSPPDRTEEYTKKFIMVQEAYEMLSDPQSRATYDLNLSRGFHFASRRRSNFSESPPIQAEEWRMRWKSQLDELGRMSMYKDSAGKTSRGTRLRRRRNSIL